MMNKIVSSQIMLKFYTPVWYLFTGKRYFKIQMNWYDDTPAIKSYFTDLYGNIVDSSILEINNGTPYYISYNLKLNNKKIYTYGNFGLIKGRSEIEYEIKGRGAKVLKMMNKVKDKKLIKKVKEFIESNDEQESFFVNDEDVQVLKLKEEPKYQTYWFKVAYLKYGKTVVFENVQDMDSLARELVDSMYRAKKTKLHNN